MSDNPYPVDSSDITMGVMDEAGIDALFGKLEAVEET